MRTSLLLIPATCFLFAVGVVAQTAKPAAPKPAAPRPAAAAPQTYKAVATVKELMDYIVIPSSTFVFAAVSTVEGPTGPVDKAPSSDSDWAEVRRHVLMLSEAANLLMVPGRHVAGPNDKSNNPGTELEPKEMDALIAKDRAGFAQKARGFVDAMAVVLKAVEAKNVDQLSEAEGAIDEACENCHLKYWYPNQVIPDIKK